MQCTDKLTQKHKTDVIRIKENRKKRLFFLGCFIIISTTKERCGVCTNTFLEILENYNNMIIT